MQRAATLRSSSLVLKAIMAITGIAWFAFLLTHVSANLLVFFDPEALNAYAAKLRHVPQLLWLARGGLALMLVLHVWSALRLTQQNRAARPVGYQHSGRVAATVPALSMRYSGILILLFLVYHLLHFTTGHLHSDFSPGDIQHNIQSAFANIILVVVYVVAMTGLGMHLKHALSSMFQSLGVEHSRYNKYYERFATIFGVGMAIGFGIIPIGVFLGWAS